MNPPGAAELDARAAALGFLACGVATLEPSRHAAALDAWLAAGYAGTMRYIHRQAKKRKSPAAIVPDARVAVVVLDNYLPEDAGSPASGRSVRVARYARGEDYHRVLRHRLGRLAAWLVERGARVAHPWSDEGPVPERELAVRAGLGWIGKNTMLIRPDAGSWCFIGTVFTDLPLAPSAPMDADRCGSCTRCLDACPTHAFVGERVLDATRCISYLTIESRAPVPDDLAPRLEGWAFGCDICNEVCPWNQRFARPTAVDQYQDRGALPLDDPGFFERMSEEEFGGKFADSPLARPGLDRMRRNWRAAFQSLERSPIP